MITSFTLYYLDHSDGTWTAFEPHLKLFANSATKPGALALWLSLARLAHPHLSERLAAAAEQAQPSSAKVWLGEQDDGPLYIFESADEVVFFAPNQRQIATSTDRLWRLCDSVEDLDNNALPLPGMIFEDRIEALSF